MSDYRPDGWALISHNDNYYVFGSWRGSYLDGDIWRRNSGIVKYEEYDDYYYFYGYSGSCYHCSKEYNHITLYNQGVLSSILSGNKGSKIISVEDFIKEFKEIV